MKLLRIFLFIIIVFNTNQAFSDENSDKLKNKISKNIRCLICQGQSIYDSQSDFAISMDIANLVIFIRRCNNI